jgi:hypothetical protein
MRNKNSFALIVLFALASIVFAQTTESIRGIVTDSDDQPLPGAILKISSDVLIVGTKTTYTNEYGIFRLPSLPIGTYLIQVTMEGYEPVQIVKADTSLQATTFVPVQMRFPSKAESITVVGEPPIMDISDSGSSTTYKNELLQEVPTRCNMTDLMQIASAISPGIGDYQIDPMVAFGSNVQSYSFNIDGLHITGPESGVVQWSVNPDLIEEIQVLGNGAPAEYGNRLNGVFNVVTKKGGNQFHGGASFFYQSDALTGTNVELDPTGLPCDDFNFAVDSNFKIARLTSVITIILNVNRNILRCDLFELQCFSG